MRNYLERNELERAILSGDREALGAALLLLASRVVPTWGKHLPAGIEFDDVVQDSVISTLRRLEKWDPARGSAFAYCTQSVRLTIREHRKAAARWATRYRPLEAAGVA